LLRAKTNPRVVTDERVNELFREHQQQIVVRTDRMFAVLLVFQWVAGIATAIWISPARLGHL
jgi:hypothetical protein